MVAGDDATPATTGPKTNEEKAKEADAVLTAPGLFRFPLGISDVRNAYQETADS